MPRRLRRSAASRASTRFSLSASVVSCALMGMRLAPAMRAESVAFRRAMGDLADALSALRGPGVSVSRIDSDQAGNPGLYAVFGSASTWKQLGLGAPPDDRPLYAGKAEKTFAARDVRDHFGAGRHGAQSPTGSSTLRRSLAALLAAERGYRGIPETGATLGAFLAMGCPSSMTTTSRNGWLGGCDSPSGRSRVSSSPRSRQRSSSSLRRR